VSSFACADFCRRRTLRIAFIRTIRWKYLHDRVLENGTIPLRQLRVHIERWMADWEADRN